MAVAYNLIEWPDDGQMNKAKKGMASQDITVPEAKMDGMLVSFMAGGTGMRFHSIMIGFLIDDYVPGLNLVACNNVIFMDLWWNPAVEVRMPAILHFRD